MAEDTTRPLCPCHSEPMSRSGWQRGKLRYVCATWRRERSRDDYWKRGGREAKAGLYAERKANGECPRCGGPPIDVVCWDCLNQMETRFALRGAA